MSTFENFRAHDSLDAYVRQIKCVREEKTQPCRISSEKFSVFEIAGRPTHTYTIMNEGESCWFIFTLIENICVLFFALI